MKREEYFHLYKVKIPFSPTGSEMMLRFCVLAFCANYNKTKTKHPLAILSIIKNTVLTCGMQVSPYPIDFG